MEELPILSEDQIRAQGSAESLIAVFCAVEDESLEMDGLQSFSQRFGHLKTISARKLKSRSPD